MPEAPVPRSSLAVLRRLAPFLAPYRARLALAFLFLVIAAGSTLVVPLAFRQLIDHGFSATVTAPLVLSSEAQAQAIPAPPPLSPSALAAAGAQASNALNRAATSHVNLYFLGLFAVALVLAMSTAARFYMVSWLGERVVADIRTAVYTRMLDQSPEFYETTRSGEVLSRLTTDTTLIQTVVGTSMSMGLRNVFLFAGGMAMLAFTSLKLFAITIGLLALVIVPIVVMGRRVRKLSRASQDRIADSSALAGEILNAMSTVQAFTQEAAEATRFRSSVENSFAAAVRRTTTRAWLTTLVITLVFGAIVFVLWLGANAVMSGTMSPGLLASFVLYAVITAGAIGGLTETWGDVLRAVGATDRLMELLDAESFIASPAKPVPFRTAPASTTVARGGVAVSFDRVRFHYPSRPDAAALDDFTLHIAAGEDGRAGRPVRRRQVDGVPAADALLFAAVGARSRSTAIRSTRSRSRTCGSRSAPCPRTRSSSRPTRARTSATDDPTRATTRSSRRPRPRRPTTSSNACPTVTRPSWASAACDCRAVSASVSRSRAPSCATRRCCCSTRRPARSTPRARRRYSARSRPRWKGARRS